MRFCERCTAKERVREFHQVGQLRGNGGPQLTVLLIRIRVRGVIADFLRIAPDWPADFVWRLPFIPGVDVSMEERHGVAEHLVVDAPQSVGSAGALDCFTE
jgi:hypothetical protein